VFRERTRHILWRSQSLAHNSDYRIFYANTQNEFFGALRALTMPILNDHPATGKASWICT